MAEHLTIETPEQISLDLPLAGIGSRFLALAFDTLVQIIAALSVFLLWVGVAAVRGSAAHSSARSVWTTALLIMCVFLLEYGYFGIFEAVWHGQTPGKRYTHLRVVKNNGQPISSYDSVARNLMRIVDSFPGIYVIGILSSLLSSQSKRLGDYVAGTVVVRELPVERPADSLPGAPQSSGPAAGQERPSVVAGVYVHDLSDQEFQWIEAFLTRRDQLSPDVRDAMATEITRRIATRLGISSEEQRRPEALLERLAAAYRARPRFP